MTNSKLAWRNLWRNKRRTLITAASVFFAVFFALVMRSIQLGSYDYMYKNVIESYSGYLQLQQTDWWYEKTINNSFEYDSEIRETLTNDENVLELIPRLESFSLASSGANTKGVMIMGIDPVKESLLSDISKKVAKYQLTPEAIEKITIDENFSEKIIKNAELFEGNYFNNKERLLTDLGINIDDADKYMPLLEPYCSIEGSQIELGDPGVWIGTGLADYLLLNPGDTLVLMGQGYHGTTAAGKFPVRGLLELPVSEISGRIVYMPYDIAQQFYNTGNQLTSVVLHLKNNDDRAIEDTKERLDDSVPPKTRITDWKEMNEVVIQQMEADNVSGMFMIGILYIVIAFGIIGTVLMMTAERKREFGVLVAIGMQKKKLASIISYEMIFIGLLGVIAGALVSIPIILYGVEHPLIFKGEIAHMMEEYDFEPKLVFESINLYFIWQLLVVGIMVLISLIHPVRKILNIKVVNALRA
ncbi:MAG TPA: FtsX-like permease family protein [Bacteroidales bacterium]|nr:FtsX-like permease family protein [Bacteroidales bacterium]